jgi:hypothetical protein
VRRVIAEPRAPGELWALVFGPRTEPVIRVRGEGDNADLVETVVNDIVKF